MLELWTVRVEMRQRTGVAWRWWMEGLAVYELAALHSRGRLPTLSEVVWSCRTRRQAWRVAELSVAGVLGWAAWHLLLEGWE